MKQPIIKLKFDQKLDREIAWNFYSNPEFGGCNFWKERALKHHPKLTEIKTAKNPKEFLNKYVIDFYKSNDEEIKTLSESTIKYLNQERDKFFLVTDKLFRKYPWPKNKFISYFSIFDFCPRFLDSGEFQVFIYDNRNLQLFTIFHELLHFIFYDFAQKNFPETRKMNTEQGKLWDIAEVFNAVIQNTGDFISLHGKIKDIGYPEHRGLILQGSRLWKKNPDARDWIKNMLK
ncbi:MAG: hypothetical protein U9N04_00820 [Patescibacteria group bacterium]|nr:hypothetical protein [Patescibacteria group bacterium]